MKTQNVTKLLLRRKFSIFRTMLQSKWAKISTTTYKYVIVNPKCSDMYHCNAMRVSPNFHGKLVSFQRELTGKNPVKFEKAQWQILGEASYRSATRGTDNSVNDAPANSLISISNGDTLLRLSNAACHTGISSQDMRTKGNEEINKYSRLSEVRVASSFPPLFIFPFVHKSRDRLGKLLSALVTAMSGVDGDFPKK